MKLFWKSSLVLAFLFATAIAGVRAQDIPDPMRPYRLVNDFAGIFSASEQQALEQKLRAYNDSTSTQIYVVTVKDLGGYAPSDYSFRLGEKWQIGQKSKNNGAVILVKPKIGNNRGQAFIANGYGLEGSLTDAFTGRVVRDEMIPYFRQNDYFGGVNAAVDAMIARLSGEFTADNSQDEEGIPLIAVIIILIVVFVVFRIFFGGGDQHIDSNGHGRGGGTVFFPPIFGRGSGGSGFGGSSGGGFGGFGGFGGGGGGSFGGGGAGGSW